LACPPWFPSRLCGVGQVDLAASVSVIPVCDLIAYPTRELLCASSAVGVGHEVESLSNMRGADARSAQIRRPDGVTASFQVRENKIEPCEPILARNLLSKDD